MMIPFAGGVELSPEKGAFWNEDCVSCEDAQKNEKHARSKRGMMMTTMQKGPVMAMTALTAHFHLHFSGCALTEGSMAHPWIDTTMHRCNVASSPRIGQSSIERNSLGVGTWTSTPLSPDSCGSTC